MSRLTHKPKPSRKSTAKKKIIDSLAQILFKDDDLFPDELADTGPEYDAWDKARNELVAEFERRSK